MSLTLHYHPLSSFCWKALVALYENGAPFTPNMVDSRRSRRARGVARAVADRTLSRAPRRDARRDRCLNRASSSNISTGTIPAPSSCSRRIRTSRYRPGCATASSISMSICRLQKIVGDRLRPAGARIRTASPRRGRSFACDPGSAMADPGPAACAWRLDDGRACSLRIAPPRRRCSTATRSSRSARPSASGGLS